METKIIEAVTRGQLKEFVRFGNRLYEGDKYFCPPLFMDEMNTLDRAKNPAFEVCDAAYFLAYRGSEVVGRIAAIENRVANEAWGVRKTRFGWFDFIDDLEVSKALLDRAAEWGRQKGLQCLNGPVGFTDMDHQGLLIEGFDIPSPMAALYNYPYYARHYEAYGLVKEADWIEKKIHIPQTISKRIEKVAEIVSETYDLKITPVRDKRDVVEKFGYSFFDVINEAYKPLYNFSPLTERQKKHYAEIYFPILNYDFVSIITDRDDRMAGLGVSMPSLTAALQKSGGRLLPTGWYHLLKAIKADKVEEVDLLLIAVRPEYQDCGAPALIFADQIPKFIKHGVRYANVTATLETNGKVKDIWDHYFELETNKRRRAFIKTF